MKKPPRKESISERVKRLVDNDPVTIRDQINFKARFGEYPIGRRGTGRSKT